MLAGGVPEAARGDRCGSGAQGQVPALGIGRTRLDARGFGIVGRTARDCGACAVMRVGARRGSARCALAFWRLPGRRCATGGVAVVSSVADFFSHPDGATRSAHVGPAGEARGDRAADAAGGGVERITAKRFAAWAKSRAVLPHGKLVSGFDGGGVFVAPDTSVRGAKFREAFDKNTETLLARLGAAACLAGIRSRHAFVRSAVGGSELGRMGDRANHRGALASGHAVSGFVFPDQRRPGVRPDSGDGGTTRSD